MEQGIARVRRLPCPRCPVEWAGWPLSFSVVAPLDIAGISNSPVADALFGFVATGVSAYRRRVLADRREHPSLLVSAALSPVFRLITE